MGLWRYFKPQRLLQLIKRQKRLYTTAAMDPSTNSDPVLFEVKNSKAIITLNKPKSLNAIDLNMVTSILSKLEEWEETQQMVIIQGVGRAFCAGGDILNVTKGGEEGIANGKTFFRTEYVMNNIIGTYKIPYIAILDGITMGGGVGLSVHGKYRIATENTLFAMPETAIGLFPDVGGTYFLPRLKGKLGMYLALTGHRLKAEDCVLAGIATHFCPSKNIPDLIQELIDTPTATTLESDVFPRFVSKAENHKFSLADHLNKIDRIFGQCSVEAMFEALKTDSSEWSLKTLETLKKMSPTSLKLTRILLDRGIKMSLQECLQLENRVAGHILEEVVSGDFYEGVRALLRDKDKNPKWSPATLEDVNEKTLEKLFLPLSEEEELAI